MPTDTPPGRAHLAVTRRLPTLAITHITDAVSETPILEHTAVGTGDLLADLVEVPAAAQFTRPDGHAAPPAQGGRHAA